MLALGGLLPVSLLRAQQNLVIHLYVDPVYGEDWSPTLSVNGFFNPDGIGLECIGGAYGPHSVQENGSSGDPLLHAPHPFRTITGAIAYVNRLAPSGGGAPLPHVDPNTGNVWSYCIIHLLPGWYGRPLDAVVFQPSIDLDNSQPSIVPTNPQPPRTHLDSKLVPNGETFPIHLPPRVSLAGTSALNTIIHTGQVGTAIELGKLVNGVALDGYGTFIDKITFYACGGRKPDNAQFQSSGESEPDPRKCAAILIDDEVASAPTISNCVFVKNVLGILVNGRDMPDGDGGPSPVPPVEPFYEVWHDGTTIINCTFAWNLVGLWNGQIDLDPGEQSFGMSRLNLLNNIFDGTETIDMAAPPLACDHQARHNLLHSWPSWQAAGGWQLSGVHSAFEGVSHEDMQVVGPGGLLIDSNAYETTTVKFNHNRLDAPSPTLGGVAHGLPATSPRIGPVTYHPGPGRNIAPYTGFPAPGLGNATPAPPRGVLYVSDLLCRGSNSVVPIALRLPGHAGFDLSPLDFRLSPAVLPATASSSNAPPNALNPLVDNGFGGPFPATMANGNVVRRPGTLIGLDSWSHDCWEADLEGFGNPRVHNHPAYADYSQGEPVDIGADELGELVVAGYRMMSTTFLRLDANPVAGTGHGDLGYPRLLSNDVMLDAVANDHVLYLGPPSNLFALRSSVALPQPDYRWLQHYGNTPGSAFPLNAYPGGYGQLATWHSAEVATVYGTPHFSSMFSEQRPYYALRNQKGHYSRLQPVPVLPPYLTPTGSPLLDLVLAGSALGDCYRATAADVTPVLLPDIHPWWLELLPVLGGLDLYAWPPSFAVWQDHSVCPGSNFLFNSSGVSVRNTYLYDTPIRQEISPPGGGLGFTDPTTTAPYLWLDNVAFITGQVPRAVRFDNWSSTTFVINDFNAWCAGGSGTGSAAWRIVVLPSSRVADSASPPAVSEVAALRFSVEWPNNLRVWQASPSDPLGSNLQSFLVVVDGAVVQQQGPQ